MQETFKLNKNLPLRKAIINALKDGCDVTEDENFYIFSNIKNPDFVLYTISYEMVNRLYNTYLKDILAKEFDKNDVRRILTNHEEKTYEKNHLAFAIKVKLNLYLKNNDTINMHSFLKFNASKIYEELDNIAELEIDSEGQFLEFEGPEEEGVTGEEADELLQVITLTEYLKLRKDITDSVMDMHVYKDAKGNFKILNEFGKPLTTMIDSSIRTLVDNLYGKETKEYTKDYELSRFATLLSYYDPERIIMYDSINGQDSEDFIRTFALLKTKLNLNCECYKSSEAKPNI